MLSTRPKKPDNKFLYTSDGRTMTSEYQNYVRRTTDWIKSNKKRLFPKPKNPGDKGQKEYWYLITFTYSTKKHQRTPAHFHRDILDIFKRKLNITYAELVQETHKDGRPHYHAAVCSSSCIKINRFNTFIKRYGSGAIRIDASNPANPDPLKSLQKYINKENTSYILVGGDEKLDQSPPRDTRDKGTKESVVWY